MKKYVKPELFYENFELSQHVAKCGWDVISATPEVCGAKGDEEFGHPGIVLYADAGVGPCEEAAGGLIICETTGAAADIDRAFNS